VLCVCILRCESLRTHYYEYENGVFNKKTVTEAPNTEDNPKINHAMRSKFNSQTGQDQVVYNTLDKKKGGYFVDLAANHFVLLSNTFSLEQHHSWSGICIEPNPMYLYGLVTRRTCNVLVNPISDKADEHLTFRLKHVYGGFVGPDMDNSNTNKQDGSDVTLTTATLTDTLDFFNAPHVIDYLSLDVEGAEYLALKTFNFSKYTFLIMSIERPTEELHKLLANNGYWFVSKLSPWGEVVYFHDSLPDLEVHMAKYVSRDGDQRATGWAKVYHHYLLVPNFWGDHVEVESSGTKLVIAERNAHRLNRYSKLRGSHKSMNSYTV